VSLRASAGNLRAPHHLRSGNSPNGAGPKQPPACEASSIQGSPLCETGSNECTRAYRLGHSRQRHSDAASDPAPLRYEPSIYFPCTVAIVTVVAGPTVRTYHRNVGICAYVHCHANSARRSGPLPPSDAAQRTSSVQVRTVSKA
jgi:hypothetical protein